MTTFMVSIRIDAKNSDEAIERISEWNLSETEGVMSISAQPELITVPEHLMVPPPPTLEAPPPEPVPMPEIESTVPEEALGPVIKENGTSV